MTLTLLAHPLSSFCWKVLIALYENGTPFEFKLLDLGDEAEAAAFRALWPIGKMPVLVDSGRMVVESSVIVEHLDVHHPGPVRLIPKDAGAALGVRMLDRIFDNYVMMPMFMIVGYRLRPPESRDPYGAEAARGQLDIAYGWLEGELAGREWAAGDSFSLADCTAGPSLHYANKVLPLGDRFPVLASYLARVEARPAFARVLEEAAPYRHLFPEEPA